MKYVCELCGNIYDPAMGDPGRKIPAGTTFADLPGDYTCPNCGSEKEAYVQVASGAAYSTGSTNRYDSQR